MTPAAAAFSLLLPLLLLYLQPHPQGVLSIAVKAEIERQLAHGASQGS